MLSSPRMALLLLFVAFPLLELALLIKSGEVIGFWPTVAILLAAAVLGFLVIRRQGLSMVNRMFATMSEGRFPLETLIDSYVLITAGFLLIAPGLISDAIGLVLLVPPLRRWGIRRALSGHGGGPPGSGGVRRSRPGRTIVIEGTYERLDDDRDGDGPKKDS